MRDIYTQLRKAGVSEHDIEIGREYIEGEADASVLDSLSQYDFANVNYEITTVIHNSLYNIKRKEEYNIAERYLRYAYALGHCTAYKIVSYYVYADLGEGKRISCGEIALVLRIANIQKEGHMTNYTISREVPKLIGKDNELIKKAIALFEKDKEYIKNTSVDYSFVKMQLYTIYFVLEYNRVAKESMEVPYYARKVILEDIKSNEDAAMLKEYENTFIENVGRLFAGTLNKTEEKMIIDILRGTVKISDMDDSIRRLKWTDNTAGRAYIGSALANFTLSPIFKNIITFCVALDESKALSCIAENDYREDFAIRGGNFDDEFGINPKTLIRYATDNSKVNIIRRQYEKHKDMVIDVYNHLDYKKGEEVLKIIKELDEKEADKLVKNGEALLKRRIAKIAIELIGCESEVNEYLFGNADISTLYEAEGRMKMGYAGYGSAATALWDYIDRYGYTDFVTRCLVLTTYTRDTSWFGGILTRTAKDKKQLDRIYRQLVSSGIDAIHLVKVISGIDSYYAYNKIYIEIYKEYEIELFAELMKNNKEEYVNAFAKAAVPARLIAFEIYKKNSEEYHNEILTYFKETAATVKEVFIEYMSSNIEYRDEVAKRLESKKSAERETAARILGAYGEDKDMELIKAAYEKEKSEKLRLVLEKILGEEINNSKEEDSEEDIIKKLLKGNKKSIFEWAYSTPFSKVHYKSSYKNGEVCEDEYIQAILVAYASVTPAGISKTGARLADNLDEKELAVFMNELFDKWVELGAQAKKRWVLYATSVHGGNDMVKKLNMYIKEWPAAARGAIAAEAVYALALNPSPQALLIVDSLARKFKFKQVKNAAGNALTYAAKQLGITRAELEDKIVPTLSFNSNMEREFDYGIRKFKVVLTQTLALEVYDEKGKKLKNLPSPGVKDDAETAKASYEEYKELKKQLKTVVASQKMRLDEALSVNRTWTTDKWRELFVDNPIMHQFATGLIWGIYEDARLTDTFRYMEDGTFNTIDEDEYELDEAKGKIGLVHPIELTDEQISKWKEQLEDYEITQPLEQLDREVFKVTEEEKKSKELVRYAGIIINDLTLTGRMTKLGWYKGSVIDGGGFTDFYREDGDYGVELSFEGAYVSPFGESTTIYETRFYKAGTVERGSYVYDYADDKKAIELGDIPERYFSEIVLQLKQVTAGCEDKDKDWRKHK